MNSAGASSTPPWCAARRGWWGATEARKREMCQQRAVPGGANGESEQRGRDGVAVRAHGRDTAGDAPRLGFHGQGGT